MRAQGIFVIIPAFNEEKRIGKVIEGVERFVDAIVVVDDGSSDQTSSKVDSKKAVVLRHPFNLGQGAAIQTGLEYAKKNKAKVMITFDADGQFRPSEIPRVADPILKDQVEVVLGSRFLGKTQNIPLSRLVTLKLGIVFTRIFSGLNLTDTYNGFRAFSIQAIKKIKITQNRMAHASEIIELIKINKLKFVEVPVTVAYNQRTFNKGLKNYNSIKLFIDLMLRKLY